MELDNATGQFRENALLFGGTPARGGNVEKYNLYHGLTNMVIGIRKMESSIKEIELKLNQVIYFLNTNKK